MRHLTIIGLILALISITPASVLVCGSVLTPELILQFNDEHDFHFEIDCTPQSPTINISTLDFSSFMQHGFHAAFFLMLWAVAGGCFIIETQLLMITGRVVPPPTPPPSILSR